MFYLFNYNKYLKMKIILTLILYSLINITKAEESLLKGALISSEETANLVKNAFDNKFNTQFISQYSSYGWVGINFRAQHIIKRIEWGTNETDESTYLLGIFEVSNEKNFEDAIPLYMITNKVNPNVLNAINIEYREPIQYIRYIGPSGQYCKINNIKIYGTSSSDSNNVYYKSSNLPLFVIHSSTGKEPQKNEILSATVNLIISSESISDYSCKFKLRGSEALNKYKKSYYIIFEDEITFHTKSQNWVLVSNYGDKTLIRNLVSYELSRIFEMEYTVDCEPIDLMVNGEYEGTYNLCPEIDISENKIKIQKMNKNDNSYPKITGGYLLEIDGFAYSGSLFIHSKGGIPISIRSPNEEDGITEEQINYIKDKFDQLENEIYNNNFTRIDITSFAKYFLLQELIGNAQAYWSTYIYKDRNNETFYFGPIFDNDMGYDNDDGVYPVNCKRNYIFNFGYSSGTMVRLINKIIENDEVIQKIKEIWKNISETKLNPMFLIQFINKKVNYLNQSRELNFKRWNIMNKKVSFNPKVYGSYEEEVNIVKNFINNRIYWLNSHVLNIKNKSNHTYCGSSPKEEVNMK